MASITDAAKELGVARRTMIRWRQKGAPGFREISPTEVHVDVDAVREWAGQRAAPAPAPAPEPEPDPEPEPSPGPRNTRAKLRQREERQAPSEPPSQAILDTLRSDEAHPISISRAAMRACARSLAELYERGELGSRDVEGLKKALEELRRAEAAYMKLEQERGQLVTRQIAAAVGGALAQRLVRVTANVESLLPQKIETWLGDPAFLALDSEDRRNVVRSWWAGQARAIRDVEADEVEAMLGGVDG